MSDIEIQAPNGDVVRFPAGTPDATILSVMRREYGGSRGGAGNQTSLPGFTAMPYATDAQGNNTVTEPPPNKGSTQEIPSTAGDARRSFVSGARQGALATFGLPGSAEWLARAGIDRASEFLGRGNPGLSNTTALPTAAQVVEEAAGQTPAAQDFRSMAVARNPNTAARFGITADPSPQPFHQPETRAGRYAHTIGEFLPGAALPAGGPRTVAQALYRRLVPNVVLPGAASEAAGEATHGTAAEPYARVAAALAAPYAPRAAARLYTPLPTTPARSAAANALAGEGVGLTAGDRTGNRLLRYAESTAAETIGAGPNIPEILANQGDQYTRAMLRRTGQLADDVVATPGVLATTRQGLNNTFERLVNNNDLVFTPADPARQRLAQSIDQLERAYERTVITPEQRRFVTELTDEINNLLIGGRIEGRMYQDLRSRLGQMGSDTTDNAFRRFVMGVQHSLDDAMEAKLPAAVAAEWRQARDRWRHLLVLEDAAASSANGVVTANELGRASRSGNRQAYAENRTPYADLAHAGSEIWGRLPNSGTPARLATMRPDISAILQGATLGRLVSSEGAQRWLGNQALAGPLNWMGRTRPGSVRRALMLPAEIQ